MAARRKRAAGALAGVPETGPDLVDDEVLATEQRRERAMAAAASVPARQSKAGERRPAGSRTARPTGKSARPSGKRRR